MEMLHEGHLGLGGWHGLGLVEDRVSGVGWGWGQRGWNNTVMECFGGSHTVLSGGMSGPQIEDFLDFPQIFSVPEIHEKNTSYFTFLHLTPEGSLQTWLYPNPGM